jgi:hypothetical protein
MIARKYKKREKSNKVITYTSIDNLDKSSPRSRKSRESPTSRESRESPTSRESRKLLTSGKSRESPKSPDTNETNKTDIFMFIYEVNTVFYKSLSDIPKADGRLVIIHPVYYEGYDNNLNSEEVVYDEDSDKYLTGSDNGSWLDIIYKHPNFVHTLDRKTIYYNEMYFRNINDLIFWMKNTNQINIIKF